MLNLNRIRVFTLLIYEEWSMNKIYSRSALFATIDIYIDHIGWHKL